MHCNFGRFGSRLASSLLLTLLDFVFDVLSSEKFKRIIDADSEPLGGTGFLVLDYSIWETISISIGN